MATDLSDGEIFEVENIIKRRIKKGKVEYLVSWKGFGTEENSWEPEKNLDGCRELIRDFLRSMKPSDFSPKSTRRRTINLPPPANAKENGIYTRIRTPRQSLKGKVLHMKLSPPPSPVASKTIKTTIYKEEKRAVEEEKQSVVERRETRKIVIQKNTSEEPKQINYNGLRIFLCLALILFFVLLLASFFKPVKAS